MIEYSPWVNENDDQPIDDTCAVCGAPLYADDVVEHVCEEVTREIPLATLVLLVESCKLKPRATSRPAEAS